MSSESTSVSSVLDLQATIESLELRIKASRVTLRDLKRDFDFPHNAQQRLDSIVRSIAAVQEQLNELVAAKHQLMSRLDRPALESRIVELEAEICNWVDTLNIARQQLREAQLADKTQPTLDKLAALSQQALSLPQAELAKLIQQLTAGQQVSASTDPLQTTEAQDVINTTESV